MKKQLLTLTIFAIIGFNNLVNAQTPNWLWAQSAGSTGNDAGNRITIDINGCVLVTGYFAGPAITFGTTTLTNTHPGYVDIFVVKYNALGSVLWAKSAGGSSDDWSYGITTDASGNVVVTGTFYSDSIFFGTTTLLNAATRNIFVVKYDASGNVLWAKSADGTDGNGISADASGNVLVTGSFDGPSITFGTITLSNAFPGYSDFFVVKYDASGNVLWAKSTGGIDGEEGQGICTDAGGNVIVTGKFYSNTITFGTTTLTNTGVDDVFVVKYDASGNVLWAESAAGADFDEGYAICTDGVGNILVAGNFEYSSITFGTITLTNAGIIDIFVVKYDASGNALWAKAAGGSDYDLGNGISTDASGNVMVTGYFRSDSITFGTTTLINSSINSPDIFIVKYDALGNVLWAKSAGGTGGLYNDDYGNGISSDASGNALVTGSFNSPSITLGTTTLTNANMGSSDIFIAKLDGTTGISDASTQFSMKIIFPDPATTNITITLTNPLTSNTTITITDMQSREVMEGKITEGNSTIAHIDVSILSPGVYLLKVNGQVQRFVKI